MKKALPIILTAALAFGAAACKKFVEPEKITLSYIPEVEIVTITDVSTSSAKVSCKITKDGGVTIIDRGICWSEEHNPDFDGNHISAGIGLGEYLCDLTDLEHATKYYVRAYAVNSYGTGYSEEMELDILPYLASVTTKDVTKISFYSAECGGYVNDDGGGTITARGVCWNTTGEPSLNDDHTNDGTETGEFSSTITGLKSNTQYHVRAYATNENGTSYGDERTFSTMAGLPVVTTGEVSNITFSSATCGGSVIDDGGFAILERGVCWNTSGYPTIDNPHTSDGSGMGDFTSSLSKLLSNTIYYVRAYATNENGTVYGNSVSFSTSSSFNFSVSETQKVHFANGNLQYQASTNTWKFPISQNSYVGNTNSNISPTYSGLIDLFGWGTGDNPTNASTDANDYSVFNDWGNNNIENGGDINNWRTMTLDEWDYLLYHRATHSGRRFAKAKLGEVNGIIIFPDDWRIGLYPFNTCNSGSAAYATNAISISVWNEIFVPNGAVFLPAGGFRNGTSVSNVNATGYYWSATQDGNTAYVLIITNESMGFTIRPCSNGYSVRLVYDVE